MDPPTSFGRWLRWRRRLLDLTQDELAQRAGCAVVTIRKFEADERHPSKPLAERLARLLALPPDEWPAFLQAARPTPAGKIPVLPRRLDGSSGAAASRPPASHNWPPNSPSVAPLPSGTLTFLVTDIAASPQLWEQHPLVKPSALAHHDAILHAAITAHAGRVFKTTGTGVHGAFSRASDALGAALVAQRALSAADWGTIGPLRVRMALHTGVAEERAGDYFGPPLKRVASLVMAGHAGQVLLSRVTTELVRDGLPSEVELRDLGAHHLKDLSRSEQIFQLVAPDLPANFPPLQTLEAHCTNLPVQPTPFIGREETIAAVRALLTSAHARLITLTGPGGVGKTRLGLQVAADLLDAFADGVYCVDLAPISNPALVASTIATTLGLKDIAGQPLIENLKRYLREKDLLLLLDNFEQVIAAAPVVAELLKAARLLQVLVTSRSALHLSGEHEVVVPPLTMPDPQHLPPHEQLDQYEAMALFVERARTVKANFQVTNATAPAVVDICHRLDGLPLAIELAAARVKLLPPPELRRRLSSRLALLTGGPRDLPARQQTLRNTIDWSYHLLDRAEQTLFTRLAVFVGGWSLEAAEAICDPEGNLGIAVLDGLQALLDKNVLRQVDGPGGTVRFRRLETIREYALERLTASGEAEALQQRHAEYFLLLAERAELELRGPQQASWLAQLEVEYDNLRAALEWAAQRGDLAYRARLAGALWRFWEAGGFWTEGRAWLAEILPEAQTATPRTVTWAKVLQGSAVLAFYLGDHVAAQSLFEQTLAYYRTLGDRRGIAWTQIYYGWLQNDGGDPMAARPLLEESLAICRELGDRQGIAWALARLGLSFIFLGEHAAARPLLEESLALCGTVDDRWGIAWAQHLLAVVVGELGDISAALALEEESLFIWQVLRDRRNRAYSLMVQGYLTIDLGNYTRAQHLLAEALTLQQEIGDKWGAAFVLWFVAVLSGVQGQAKRAVRLESASTALVEAIGAELPVAALPRFMHKLQVSHQTLTPDNQGCAWAEGRAMTVEQAIAYALEQGIEKS